jgi:hypothetical protein
MFIYLAGTLTYYKKTSQFIKALSWRKEIIEFLEGLNIKYYDPAQYFANEINHTYDDKLIVAQNKFYLDKSDILIVCTNDIKESPGTQWELYYGSLIKNIPIIAFGDKSWSPHINSSITNQCESINECIELLRNMFKQDFKSK